MTSRFEAALGARWVVGVVLGVWSSAAARAVPAMPADTAPSADVGGPIGPPPTCDVGEAAQSCGSEWYCGPQVCFSDMVCSNGRVCIDQPVRDEPFDCGGGVTGQRTLPCDAANPVGCYATGICSLPEQRVCDGARALLVCGSELRCQLRACSQGVGCRSDESCRARYVQRETLSCDGAPVEALEACAFDGHPCETAEVCVDTATDTEPGPEVDAEFPTPSEPFADGTGAGSSPDASPDASAGLPTACGAAGGWVDPALGVLALLGSGRLRRRAR